MKIRFYIFLVTAALSVQLKAQESDVFFKSSGSPVNPRIKISWNRYNTYEGVMKICRDIASAYPELARMEIIGKSFEGRDIPVLIVSNSGKNDKEKPGYYIDGNIHSNEIQGTEIALYTAWYLTETYATNSFIRDLLNDKVFYIVPTINPDSRTDFMDNVNNANTPRSGKIPIDDDRDGLVNEDGFDDLDGDGNLAQMRRKTPFGQYRIDPADPNRMIKVENGQFGDYEILGNEGIDNDGDGAVNEDPVGAYDPNRDWSYNWQPSYLQGGALPFPFFAPENKAVRDFVIAHPNIAGAQTYHNSGGMILRGPGQQVHPETYMPADDAVINTIGQKGQKIIPGYRFYTLWRDLYPVYGGEIDWFYGARGIYTFSNELFTEYLYFGKTNLPREESEKEEYDFDRYLLFGDAFIPWKEIDHPQFGKIEIGGFKKNFGRTEPGFLLESEAHRNMAFTLFHAYHTPQLSIEKIKVKDIGNGLQEVTVDILNSRLSPTRSGQNRKYNIDPEDKVIIHDVKAFAKMVVHDDFLDVTTVQTSDPSEIRVETLPGMFVTKVRWITERSRKFSVSVVSAKGGRVSMDFREK